MFTHTEDIEDSFNLLFNCTISLLQCNFSSAPFTFFHNCTRNVMFKICPVVFVSVPDKHEKSNKKTCELKQNLKPETMLINFEKAVVNALGEIFPRHLFKKVFFHFYQAI